MEIILIRHGQTKGNVEKRFAGFTDSPLTDKGRSDSLKRVQKTIEALEKKEKKITHIYSSPLSRAKFMAENFSKELNLSINFSEDIKEMNFGILENMSFNEVLAKYPKEVDEIYKNDEFQIPEGESFLEFKDRIDNFLNNLIEKHDEESNIVVICHGGVIQTALTLILGIEHKKRWNFKVQNTGFVSFEVIDGFKYINV